jgi:hypothetical protein
VVPIEELLTEAEKCKVEEAARGFLRNHKQKLPANARYILEHYEYAHMARTAIGVGGIGVRSWILLLLRRDSEEPLFLQFKEAQASALEPYLTNGPYIGRGRRIVEGQHLLQSTSDIFLGWDRVRGMPGDTPRDYYVRQIWDWRVSADIERMPMRELLVYGQVCGWTLARAHARSGDRIAIAEYLGKGPIFDRAIAEFAASYADRNERDYQALRKAVESGAVKAQIRT